MMGGDSDEDRGIVPRLCEALFARMEQEQSADLYVGRGKVAQEVGWMIVAGQRLL